MNPIALITGATAGIGMACAHRYAAASYDLIITGRRSERLEKISEEISLKYKVRVLALSFDVQDRAEVDKQLGHLPGDWKNVDILINNAGLALGRDAFQEADIDDWERMLDTNVYGLLYVSRAIIPAMISRKKGHIVNIGSIAGKQVYANGNVYCASKAAVDAISQSMRIDLLPHNIRVTAIHPGAVETEFSLVRYKGNSGQAEATYKGYTPLSADNVADTIFFCTSQPAHVCINDLVLTCTQQADVHYFQKSS